MGSLKTRGREKKTFSVYEGDRGEPVEGKRRPVVDQEPTEGEGTGPSADTTRDLATYVDVGTRRECRGRRGT